MQNDPKSDILWQAGALPMCPLHSGALDGDRAANSRLRKMIFWLETARLAGFDPEAVIFDAQKRADYAGKAREDADQESLVRDRIILERLGCLDAAGMVALRKGNSPTITNGPYAGDTVDADTSSPAPLPTRFTTWR